MKGITLPINMLIVISIGLVALLGTTALWFTGFSPFSSSVSVDSAKNAACAELIRKGCNTQLQAIWTPNFDSDKDGRVGACSNTVKICGGVPAMGDADNLYMLCECWYGMTTTTLTRDCRKLCGCPS